MVEDKNTGGLKLFTATAAWWAGLVAAGLLYHLISGLQLGVSGGLWIIANRLAGLAGLLLPYVCFAGGVAAHRHLPSRSVATRAFLLSIVSYALLAYGLPVSDYRAKALAGADVATDYPTGPLTPAGLQELRSAVQADPPAAHSFAVGQPYQKPPNWLTYLIHSLAAISLFAILAAILGQQTGFLTSGLSPPARLNARWALGLLTAGAFFVAEAAGGEWVRLDPSNSGVLASWLPLVVPLLEYAILWAIVRRRGLHLHTSDPSGV